ncbi:LysR family transcriptional regulator [Intrasporangium sp. YIM S08009]|uniref:LysR family transcriptional regulator n=1 Tax=Intrasporangium zincisolvens TaxID=3080018 RepID=UPI002B05E660|nr:LysR family transcriptional regulator [Intrasporangium sp. YIM S08009]
METRHLEFFVAVADELSFTRAAERVQAVQSTVSAGIRALEREVGSALFDRSTRHVSLTPTGRALLAQARTAVAAVEEMREVGARSRGQVRGTLRIGMITNLESLGLPAVVGEFHRAYPDVELSLRTSPRGSTGLLDDVRRGRSDVAFCGLAVAELVGVHVRVLRRQPFVALLPPGHSLEGADRVSVRDLLGDDFVEMPKGFGNRRIVDDWLAEQALTRRVTMEVPDLTTVPDYVSAGLGVAVVPAQAAPPAPAAHTGTAPTIVPLVEPLVWELSVIAREQGRSPAVDALLEHLGRRLPGGEAS